MRSSGEPTLPRPAGRPPEQPPSPDDGRTRASDAETSYRSQLSSGEDIVDPSTWAGSVPVAHGIAPRVRVGRSRWFNLLWLLPIGFALLIVAVATAKGLRNVSSVQRFIADHPGTIASSAAPHTAALPIWVGVQHFFNLFLLIFIEVVPSSVELRWRPR